MSVSNWVIVLNYNLSAHCLRLLDALGQAPDFGVFIVDNHSREDDYAVLRKACTEAGAQVLALGMVQPTEISQPIGSGQRLILASAPRNLGYAGGNNLALRALQATLGPQAQYLVLNPDVVITPTSVQALFACAADICGPAVYEHYRQSISRDNQHIDFSTGFAAPPGTPLNCLSGCCLKLSAHALERYGLLPEENFLYDEEVKFFERVHRAGGAPVYLPEVTVEHLGSASVGKRSMHYFYYIFRNRLLYFLQEAGPRYHRPGRFARYYAAWWLGTFHTNLKQRNWRGAQGLLLAVWHGLRRVSGPLPD